MCVDEGEGTGDESENEGRCGLHVE
jgi:hypothetical protein